MENQTKAFLMLPVILSIFAAWTVSLTDFYGMPDGISPGYFSEHISPDFVYNAVCWSIVGPILWGVLTKVIPDRVDDGSGGLF